MKKGPERAPQVDRGSDALVHAEALALAEALD
jgi:hypothetical protein